MKKSRVISTLLFTLIVSIGFAQPDHAKAYGKRGRDAYYRRHHDCNAPFPARSFNRDYPGLANSNLYYLQKTLQDYTRYHCLSSEQVRRLAMLFPTDREKYDYLTFAFEHVFDVENYAMTGTVLANRNAKDAFYRFLVREGVPAGDYFTDPYVVINDPYRSAPQYRDRYGNIIADPRYNNDGYASRNNNPYDYDYDRNNDYLRDRNGNRSPFDNNSNGINSGYNGGLTYQEFDILKEQVRRNTLDKGKLDDAKRLTRENRLTSNQIVEITRLFNFDNNKLEYAKFAYDYAYDRENYRQVIDVLAYDVNKKELMKYIEKRR